MADIATATKAATDTKFVTVGCKLPNGLHLDILDSATGLKTRHSIRGSNSSKVEGGYGITRNVPADFFAEWMRRNAGLPAVANKLIFAHANQGHVEGRAKEEAGRVNGLEPIDPKNPGHGLKPFKPTDDD